MEPIDPGIISGYRLLLRLCSKAVREGDFAAANELAKRVCEQHRFVEAAGFELTTDLFQYFLATDEPPFPSPADLTERRLNVLWKQVRLKPDSK